MMQEDVDRSQEFRKCIECFLCQDTCHVVRDHEENKQAFAGPRFLMRVAELDMHPLDAASESGLDRKTTAQDEHGLGYCNITKCCTEVCPEGIKITDNALIPAEGTARSTASTTRWYGWAGEDQEEVFSRLRAGRRPLPGAVRAHGPPADSRAAVPGGCP
ncbi:hypothetical protein SPURM210S_03613 [Streptomyces purpurascens]